MPETNPYAAGFFFAGEPGANLKLREKLALAMMMQKQKAPQNLGEGIYSAGDSIGDAIMARQLMQQDKDAQLAASKLGAPADPSAITPLSQAPQEVEPAPPVAAAPRVIPAPGNLPPTGEPGNTGADTFQPPFQPPPRTWPTPGPIAAPQPYPPPAAAPMPDAAPPPTSVARPSVADFGQKPVLAPTPPPGAPVVAQGGEDDPRRATALAMLRQGQTGQPPSQAFAPAAAPPPVPPPTDQGIKPAPPAAQVAQVQLGATAGYVPPVMADPAGAPIVPPTKREMELQAILAANAGNPHAADSPAARELKHLGEIRARKQEDAVKLFEAGVTRATKREEQRQQALIDQDKRILESQESRLRIGDLPAKLNQEGLKRQQELIAQPGQAGGQSSPLLGTERSPQRTGIPVADPAPAGVIPAEWAKAQEKKITADAAGLDSAKPELAEALDLMKQAREHPWKSASLGTGGKLAQMTAGGQGFAAMMEQLGGKNLVAAYQKIKGTGPVSEQEGANIAKAQARLTTAQSEADYDKAMNDLEGSLRGAVERAERRMNRPVTAYQKSPDDPVAPDIGQIGTRGGKQVEYVGGDPSKDSSYKTVRR